MLWPCLPVRMMASAWLASTRAVFDIININPDSLLTLALIKLITYLLTINSILIH